MVESLHEWRKRLANDGQAKKVNPDDLIAAIGDIKCATLADIANSEQPPRPWFFQEIVPSGAFLITGRSKVGKSWFLM
jgi:hypothetical protein